MHSVSETLVGFIGLGIMGRPMAMNLYRAGARVTVHNRSPEAVQELAAAGLIPADSPRAVGQGCDLIFLMLTDTPAVEQVLFGDQGLAAALGPGKLVVDMGTTAVNATRDFARRVEERGADYVDAPVSGGQMGAEQASLSVMIGGHDPAVARARPYLEVLGRRLTHVGGPGAGQVAKAANQVIVGLTIGAVAEALTLARRAGVDPAKVREALLGGFADSRILELHGRRMISGDFRPGGRVSTQHKDLSQALDLAASLDLELPATALCRSLYERLLEQGEGDLDHSALIRALEGR